MANEPERDWADAKTERLLPCDDVRYQRKHGEFECVGQHDERCPACFRDEVAAALRDVATASAKLALEEDDKLREAREQGQPTVPVEPSDVAKLLGWATAEYNGAMEGGVISPGTVKDLRDALEHEHTARLAAHATGYAEGVDEGRSTQAKLELAGRDRFLDDRRSKEQAVKEKAHAAGYVEGIEAAAGLAHQEECWTLRDRIRALLPEQRGEKG